MIGRGVLPQRADEARPDADHERPEQRHDPERAPAARTYAIAVGIAQVGWIAYLSFVALISISLGVLNLLPVPLLDGGHLMYYTIEILKGRPVSERAMQIGQQVGMAVLFTLMLLALFNDVNRLISN